MRLQSITTPAGTAAATIGLFALVWKYEWRILRREPAWWLALAVLSMALALAGTGMQDWLGARAAEVHAASVEQSQRLADWNDQLVRIERGEAAIPEAPYRDPGNALFVGRNAAAYVVPFQPSPMAGLSTGLTDLWPTYFKVGSGSQDKYLFVDNLTNPSFLLAGRFDPSMVLVLVLPLLIVLGNAGLYADEQVQGTLPLIRSAPVPLWKVLALKLALRAGSIILASALVCMATVAWAAPQPPSAAPLLLLGLGIAAWGVFWAALAWAVNSMRRSAAFNTMALACSWLLIVVLLPALASGLAGVVYPVPSREDVVLAVREAAVDTERDLDAERARFEQSHSGNAELAGKPSSGPASEGARRAFALAVAADARADRLLAEQESRVRKRQDLLAQVQWLVPSLLMQQWLADLAGNGGARWQAHVQDVAVFHKQWQHFFIGAARESKRLTTADQSRFPAWNPSQPLQDGAHLWDVLRVPGWLMLLSSLLLVWGAFAMRDDRP